MSTPLLHKERGSFLSDNKYLPTLVGIMALFIAIGGFGVHSVTQEIEDNLVDQLQLTLVANVASLRLFLKIKSSMPTQVLADQPEIRKNILSLIELTTKDDASVEKLKQSASLKWLREQPWQSLLKIRFYRIRNIRSDGITSRGTT